ncbi:MAG: hypothetical protein CMG07_04725 [Candidatus Marinimicrobia bacterium]|nr:hypothetical protein [Candidatus Neomarinimicrobiota bacterium]
MKQLISKIFILSFTLQFAYGVVGFGVYGNTDSFSTQFDSFNVDPLTFTPLSLDNAVGIGLYFYVDALPFVDLQADLEFVGKDYDFNIEGLDQALPMAWARMSTYFSLRKKIIGVGIPFLAKAQIYGGAGINSHQVTPKMSAELITNANLDETLNTLTSTGSFDANAFAQDLGDYAKDNRETFSGVHVMVGLQAKLLTFNMMANLRYTMAKDVIPGKSGFPSAYVGLGIGI